MQLLDYAVHAQTRVNDRVPDGFASATFKFSVWNVDHFGWCT